MEKLKEIIKTFIKWVSVDGLLHIETSMLIYLIVSLPIYLFYGLLFSIPLGFVITFMIGCYKEFILEPPQKIKSDTVSTVSPSISHEVVGLDAMIFIF